MTENRFRNQLTSDKNLGETHWNRRKLASAISHGRWGEKTRNYSAAGRRNRESIWVSSSQVWLVLSRSCRTKSHEFLDLQKVGNLVAPCGWEFNRSRGRGWESRPLSRFHFALILKRVLDIIALLSRGWAPPSGLERGGWGLPPAFGCEIGRDRGLPIALPIAEGVL